MPNALIQEPEESIATPDDFFEYVERDDTGRRKRRDVEKSFEEFPIDSMMQDLHFIRELIFALKKKEKGKTYMELSEIAREEFIDWLKVHPEGFEVSSLKSCRYANLFIAPAIISHKRQLREIT